MTDFTIIEAPSNLGLKPDSVEHLAGALLDAGLARRLDARRHARLAVPPYDPRRDPDTGILNAARIRDFSVMLADIVGPVVARGGFPVVLGGDCSILLGNLLALRRSGKRHGLLFLDGHADFYQPEASPTGEAADMDLALSTGRGPDVLTNIEGLRPLVRDADVAVFGPRDAEQARELGSQPLPPTIFAQDLDGGSPRRRRRGGARRDRAPRAGGRRTASGSTSTSTCWTMRSCRRSAIACRAASPGRSWRPSSTPPCAAVLRAASTSRSSSRSTDTTGSIARDLVNTLARGLVRSPDARLELCAQRQRRFGMHSALFPYALAFGTRG